MMKIDASTKKMTYEIRGYSYTELNPKNYLCFSHLRLSAEFDAPPGTAKNISKAIALAEALHL